MRFIKRAQDLGFSLNEIRELLELRIAPRARRADMRARAEAKIGDVEQKIRALEAIRKTLRKLTERCAGGGPLDECPILESLDLDEEHAFAQAST